MSPEIQQWQSQGEYIPYGPFEHQLFTIQLGDAQASAEKTLLLIHGFPESSYSYHLVIEGLLDVFDRIILFDMLGYGLSDKPISQYSYSLFEQADSVFTVWRHYGITGGHILSHDMGDSVATEILARNENGILPSWLKDGIRSMTFTNGSMVLGLAQLRITQKLLLSKYGSMMKNLVSNKLFCQQVKSAHGNSNLSDEEIEKLWELNTLQEGHKKSYLTIRYLNDRKRFEKIRWLPALAQTKLPIHIAWGDEDNVAKVEMAHYLKKEICPEAKLTIMNGLGHFCQLGSPKAWLQHINSFYLDQVKSGI